MTTQLNRLIISTEDLALHCTAGAEFLDYARDTGASDEECCAIAAVIHQLKVALIETGDTFDHITGMASTYATDTDGTPCAWIDTALGLMAETTLCAGCRDPTTDEVLAEMVYFLDMAEEKEDRVDRLLAREREDRDRARERQDEDARLEQERIEEDVELEQDRADKDARFKWEREEEDDELRFQRECSDDDEEQGW